jgi:hypothetical protein
MVWSPGTSESLASGLFNLMVPNQSFSNLEIVVGVCHIIHFDSIMPSFGQDIGFTRALPSLTQLSLLTRPRISSLGLCGQFEYGLKIHL